MDRSETIQRSDQFVNRIASFVSDLDCKVTSPAAISIIADWNGGDQIRIEGLVKDVTMGSVDLDQCHLSK
jgi:hypothetical protein